MRNETNNVLPHKNGKSVPHSLKQLRNKSGNPQNKLIMYVLQALETTTCTFEPSISTLW